MCVYVCVCLFREMGGSAIRQDFQGVWKGIDMRMHVYELYVCVYVCVCLERWVDQQFAKTFKVRKGIDMRVHVYDCMHLCVYVHVCMGEIRDLPKVSRRGGNLMCVYKCVCVCVCVCMCVHVSVCACLYWYMCVCVCVTMSVCVYVCVL